MNTAQSRSIPIMTSVIVIPFNTYCKNPEMQVVAELRTSFQQNVYLHQLNAIVSRNHQTVEF